MQIGKLCHASSASHYGCLLFCQQVSAADPVCEVISDNLLVVGFSVHSAKRNMGLNFQEYLSLGSMQRKHFSLEQINSALDFMQTLTCNGELC